MNTTSAGEDSGQLFLSSFLALFLHLSLCVKRKARSVFEERKEMREEETM
jgi:hypothetical protein